jgi:hypothetical protein
MTAFFRHVATVPAMKPAKTALVLAATLGLLTTGCQTFSLTDEEFYRQQRGQPADPEVGTAVGAVGTVGYLGAMIGKVAAGGKH